MRFINLEYFHWKRGAARRTPKTLSLYPVKWDQVKWNHKMNEIDVCLARLPYAIELFACLAA